jgi:hypothetical protein
MPLALASSGAAREPGGVNCLLLRRGSLLAVALAGLRLLAWLLFLLAGPIAFPQRAGLVPLTRRPRPVGLIRLTGAGL